MKILIVEDSHWDGKLLLREIHNAELIGGDEFVNIEVRTAIGFTSGLEIAARFHPDIALIDVNLHGNRDRRGISLGRELYMRYNIPIVLKSVVNDMETIASGLQEACYGFVCTSHTIANAVPAAIQFARWRFNFDEINGSALRLGARIERDGRIVIDWVNAIASKYCRLEVGNELKSYLSAESIDNLTTHLLEPIDKWDAAEKCIALKLKTLPDLQWSAGFVFLREQSTGVPERTGRFLYLRAIPF